MCLRFQPHFIPVYVIRLVMSGHVTECLAWEKRWAGGVCSGLDRLPSALSKTVNQVFALVGRSFFTVPLSPGLARHGWFWFWSRTGLWLGRPFGPAWCVPGCVLDRRGGLSVLSDLTCLSLNRGFRSVGSGIVGTLDSGLRCC